LPTRVMTVLTLGATASALVLFGLSGGWVPGYYVAALVAGIAGSGNYALLDKLQTWIGLTTDQRRASGWQNAKLGEGVGGLAVFGIVVTLSGSLNAAGALASVSLLLATGLMAGLTAVVAVASWFLTPAERFDRPAPPTLVEAFVDPFRLVARSRFALSVLAVYGTYAFTLGSIDSVWRFFFADIGAPWLATFVASLAFVSGGMLLAGLFVPTDLAIAASKRRGDPTGSGLLKTWGPQFVAGAAALMAAGGMLVAASAHGLLIGPVLGTIIGLNMLEVTSTGKLLGLNAVINGRTGFSDREKTATKVAGGLVKAVFQVVGSLTAIATWHGAGYGGVSLQVAVAGVLTFLAATAVEHGWLRALGHRIRAGPILI
jgi:hypothetical protein